MGAQYDLGRIYQKHGLNYDFKRDKAKRNYLKMNKEMSDNIFYALVCILLVVIGHVTSQLFTNPFSSESIAALGSLLSGTSSVFLGVLGIKTMRVWKTQSTSNDLSELLYLMHKIKLLSSEIATQNSVINLELDERIDSRLSHQDGTAYIKESSERKDVPLNYKSLKMLDFSFDDLLAKIVSMIKKYEILHRGDCELSIKIQKSAIRFKEEMSTNKGISNHKLDEGKIEDMKRRLGTIPPNNHPYMRSIIIKSYNKNKLDIFERELESCISDIEKRLHCL